MKLYENIAKICFVMFKKQEKKKQRLLLLLLINKVELIKLFYFYFFLFIKYRLKIGFSGSCRSYIEFFDEHIKHRRRYKRGKRRSEFYIFDA